MSAIPYRGITLSRAGKHASHTHWGSTPVSLKSILKVGVEIVEVKAVLEDVYDRLLAATFLYHLCSVDSGKCDPLFSPPISLSYLEVSLDTEGRG